MIIISPHINEEEYRLGECLRLEDKSLKTVLKTLLFLDGISFAPDAPKELATPILEVHSHWQSDAH